MKSVFCMSAVPPRVHMCGYLFDMQYTPLVKPPPHQDAIDDIYGFPWAGLGLQEAMRQKCNHMRNGHIPASAGRAGWKHRASDCVSRQLFFLRTKDERGRRPVTFRVVARASVGA